MGGETYCYLCGGPVQNNDFKFIQNITYVKDLIMKIKKEKIRNAFLDGYTIDIIEDLMEYLPPDQINLVKKIKIKQASRIPKYKWLENLLILHKSGKNISVKEVDSWERDFKNKKTGEMYYASFEPPSKSDNISEKNLVSYDPKSSKFFGDGYICHVDCYKICESKYGSFTFKDLHLAFINYGKSIRAQEVQWYKFFFDNLEYLLESPLKNKKNKTRILKINLPITKVITSKTKSLSKKITTISKKVTYSRDTRPSPSISATTQKKGTIMTGNDGNKWIIIVNKLGILRWQKLK